MSFLEELCSWDQNCQLRGGVEVSGEGSDSDRGAVFLALLGLLGEGVGGQEVEQGGGVRCMWFSWVMAALSAT